MLVKPGWLAIYGKEAENENDKDDKDNGKTLVPVANPVRMVRAEVVDGQGPGDETRPPARYSEATLLSRHGRCGQN